MDNSALKSVGDKDAQHLTELSPSSVSELSQKPILQNAERPQTPLNGASILHFTRRYLAPCRS